jgi:hypothetical protein
MPIPVPTPSPTTFSCPAGKEQFTLDMFSDRFGSETTWKVVNDCNGETVLFNGPYSQGFVTRYLEQYCLSSGQSYTFTIFDSFGGKSHFDVADRFPSLRSMLTPQLRFKRRFMLQLWLWFL